MKKIIITGVTRTGTTALTTLLSQSSNILVTHELAIFDYNRDFYHKRKRKFLLDPNEKDSRCNSRFLKEKGLTEKDIDDFFIGDFKNKGKLEFFGDKFPTYCTTEKYCKHLVENHSDAYFIFTYRNPCATIYSDIKRSRIDKNEKADWYFRNLEDSTNRIINYTNNWSNFIYPNVDKKIIIDYDYYINNVNLLINDLNIFLNTKIDIFEPDKILGNTELFDTGFRGLYEHPNPDEYKDNISQEQIDFILDKTMFMNNHIKSLINKN